MDSLLKDVLHALRSLAHQPAFATAAVITLALGIGANTAIFSVVYGVLLRPLPYPGADRIVMVWNHNTREGIERDVTSYPNFLDWHAGSDAFEALAGYTRSGTAALTDGGEPEQVGAALVTADFLDVFATSPALGRGFAESDMQPGSGDVVLLSTALWQRRFGGDPGVIGHSIVVNGTARTVIGVLPATFDHPAETDLWVPLAPTGRQAEARGSLWLSVVGRVRSDVPLERAQEQMTGVAARLAEEYPGPNTGAGIMLEPLQQTISGEMRTPLLVLLGAVAVVLLICCANVANLLLARGTMRRREIAIRSALGAGAARVARQLLTESVILALVGAAAGVVLAVWAVTGLLALAPAELPRLDAVRIDAAVLGFTLLVAVGTGLLFGLAPLLQIRRMDVATGLREEARSTGRREVGRRLRPALIGGEVALAFVLLVAAGLLLRSFAALSVVQPGFEPEGALTFRITLPTARYDSGERLEQAHAELLARFRGVSGVTAAGAASTLFLSRLPNMAPITLEGDAPPGDEEMRESVVIESATPGFFEAMGMRLVRGRALTEADRQDGLLAAVVNEAFVRRYLPDGEPIGRRFTFGDPGAEDTDWLEIVGVIRDARRSGLAERVRPEAYLSHAQRRTASLTYVLRAAGEPLALLPAVRSAVRDVDPLLPVAATATIEQSLAESLAARRFVAMLLGGFAALAAVLAAVGIYGVVSYLVAQRTRELGVRFALGARRGDVLRLVLGQSLRYVLPGIIGGAAMAVAVTRLLRSQLYGVEPHDALTFTLVPIGILAVTAAATLLPAARAALIDPMLALRRE